jgi:GNAT superfamily N-acetyltransferase
MNKSSAPSNTENTPPSNRSSDLIDVTVYYLEMFACPERTVPAPCAGLSVHYVAHPTVEYYRTLYDAVGKDYRWLSRRKMSDQALAAIIGDPRDEIHVLSVDGQTAGFAELDRRQPDEVELVQFGLLPSFIGKGLGKWFLNWTISRAFSNQPKRFWLHTCTFDHPAALPNYLNAGFVEYNREIIRRDY